MENPRKGPSGIRPAALFTGTNRYSGEPSLVQGSTVVVHTSDPERDIYHGEEWQLACRVAASKGLSKSELLPKFLLHVCELTLSGRADQITEQRVGTQIFNRSADYNPGEDNIVRSYARTMRKRLDEYFDHEGKHERLRIHMPRGGYVPIFEPAINKNRHLNFDERPSTTNTLGATERADETLLQVQKAFAPALVEAKVTAESTWRSTWFPPLAGLIVGMILVTAGWLTWNGLQTAHDQSAAHVMWSQIFQTNRNTLIVPADSGLGILENLSRRSVTVEQYANGSYLAAVGMAPGVDKRNLGDLSQQRYTSFVDLDIATSLQGLPEFTPSRTRFRFSRGVTTEDIRDSNVILLGSKHTDPWVALFERKMNFTLEYTSTVDESYVLNHAPKGTEPSIYKNRSDNSSSPTYGVIAYLPGLGGAGHALIIEGLNMAATQAAAAILFNEEMIGPVLKQAESSDGTIFPFELLVETNSIGAASPGAQIIDTRIYAR